MPWRGGGGLLVSVPAFYSDDPSSNPAGYLINFMYERTKINEKEAGVGPSLKIKIKLMPWRDQREEMTCLALDSNPRQWSCTRLGPLKDALPAELCCRILNNSDDKQRKIF